MSRAEKAAVAPAVSDPALPPSVTAETVGELLLAVVALARKHSVDAEAALREAARGMRVRCAASSPQQAPTCQTNRATGDAKRLTRPPSVGCQTNRVTGGAKRLTTRWKDRPVA